ncbi:Hsp33 family molecular chaperone HslO [Orrella sp. NBD-18]|uniref:Hsp33 family molecular chaperone HslO n=1 Tax=Sheuella amnicola TaxID=2707330 RepID=A0A6B2QX39_9BURK|nr:Hsp33 family molecular chaperone HslO [Sheuella amnicola]NDY83216.1 Hsp33 family molecular chaperone HslO [Sheuella amnicola]
MQDYLKKYLLEDKSVRIESVRMGETWRDAQSHHAYPPVIAALLGELVAASTLLAANLKFDGSLLLQMQGDGAIALMVAECRADMSVRATVKLRDKPIDPTGDLQSLLNPGGTAKFIVVLDPPKNTPGRQAYQGIVPLEGDTIAEALEQYMKRSEQLDTKIMLAADSQICTGLLLQRLPIHGGSNQTEITQADESWNRALHLVETVKHEELLKADQDVLLHRLFWEEPLIAFEPHPVTWKCSCTREKVADMLRMLGKQEVESILLEQGKIEVACEFCAKPYLFDAIDADGLFQAITTPASKTLH